MIRDLWHQNGDDPQQGKHPQYCPCGPCTFEREFMVDHCSQCFSKRSDAELARPDARCVCDNCLKSAGIFDAVYPQFRNQVA